MGLLDVLADFFEALPFRYLLVGHCLAVASWLTHLSPHFMQSYWIGFLAAFGGGTITALVIGDRGVAPLAILSHNGVGVAWTVCWWLLNYSPLAARLAGLLDGFLPLRVATKACVNVLRAQLISSRVDLATKLYPGVVAAPLLLGTLAGGAGKMATDPLIRSAVAGRRQQRQQQGQQQQQERVPTAFPRTEFSSPGFSLRSAALAALFQAAAAHWLAFLSEREAGAAIVAALVVHGAAVDVASWWVSSREGEGAKTKGKKKGEKQTRGSAAAPAVSLDFTAAPAALLHSLSRIPVPHQQQQQQPQPRSVAAASPAAPAAVATRSSSRNKKTA